MRVTVDTNALLNLRNGTGDIANLGRLRALHHNDIIRLCVPAIIASERQPGGLTLEDYPQFERFLSDLGLGDSEELLPMCYLDVSYLDHCLLTEPAMEDLEESVHQVLFPKVEFSYEKYAAKAGIAVEPPLARRWLNAKCDVQAIWSHVWHGADIFVTEDANFHKLTKKPRLIGLGAGEICRPGQCISILQAAGVRP